MTAIEDLIRRGAVQRVPVDSRAIHRLMDDAERHLATSSVALESGDLAGAYQLAYDAARKSLTALALSRGLRTKGEGAHATLISVIQLEFSTAPGVETMHKLDSLRRTRNRAQYSGHWFDEREVVSGMDTARAIVQWVTERGAQ
jgi:uncharacterized protein (UPF0332 family)